MRTRSRQRDIDDGAGRASVTILVGLGCLLLGFGISFLLFMSPLGARGTGAEAHGHDAHRPDQLWTCGMHPEVLQDEPGTCPICHMDLTPVSASDDPPEAQLWTCGMHPEVLQDEPGTCPICHMDLTPVEGAAHAHDDEWVPGDRPTVRIDPAVVQNMGVTSAPVRRQNIERVIRSVGYIEFDQEKMVTVTTKYTGFVEKVHANYIGQSFRRGEPLFEIYSPDLVQTQQELLSALEYAERLEGAPEDATRRASALAEAARQRLRYWDITDAQIENLETSGRVERTLTVYSPSSGVVMKRRDGLEGAEIRPGMDVIHLADLSSLWLKVEIFEDQLAWIEPGAVAEVSLTYFPGETITGRVLFVEPELSEKTRTARLTLRIPNRSGRLRAGMYATVVFRPLARRDALVVPSQSVLRSGERDLVVLSLGEGRFKPREVRLGFTAEGVTEVLEGLDEDDVVVTSAQFLIDSESNLRAAIEKLAAGHAGH